MGIRLQRCAPTQRFRIMRTVLLSLVALFMVSLSARAQSPNYASGFTSTGLALNGGAAISGTRLRLTDGGASEARSAFYNTPVNVQSFSNDFSFQLTSATADGFTFTIQGIGSTAVGSGGGALGYGLNSKGMPPDIASSVAVAFSNTARC